jgi:hypothetical protein
LNRSIELGAAVFTLAGMYIGSTTLWGALMYFVACVFWHALTYRTKMWGLIPLNAAAHVISMINIWKAIA